MLKQEWKNVFHQHWMKVVLIAIILIPSLYACIFLGSMWDPYGNTDKIPVAVVNQDHSINYGNHTLHIGKELTENLKKNSSMDFQCIEESKAQEGLKNGRYYMIITIPKDFSQNATTLLNEHPQKMKLHYTTNPGNNYIASKMDDSAIEKIKSEVSQTVTRTYAQTIFEQITTLTDGLKEANDGTHQLFDGTQQLVDGNQLISHNLQVLAKSSLTFENGAQTLTQGLEDYTEGVLEVNDGVYTLKEGLDTFHQSVQPLNVGIQELSKGSSSLNEGIQQYTGGVSSVYQGVQQLIERQTQLNNGMVTLNQGTCQLVEGNKQVSEGLTQLNQKLASMDTEKISAITKTTDSFDQATLLLNQLISSDSTMAQKWMNQRLSANEAENIAANQQEVQYLLTHYSYIELEKMMVNGNQEAISQLITSLTEVYENTQQLEKGSQQIQVGLENLDMSIEKTLIPGMKSYIKGVQQIGDGIEKLDNQNQKLLKGSQQLTDGLASLQQQTPALINGIEQLNQGAKTLYEGTSQITSHNETLLQGSRQLSQGSMRIKDGAQQLSDGTQTLNTGLKTLQDGIQTLDERLAEGVKKTNLKIKDQSLDMMAAPVETDHDEISTVTNNGHAMAPYMMSVALYVAALAFTLMYPIRKDIEKASSPLKYWMSKASVMYSVSTLSAVILIFSLSWICHFKPQQLLMTYIFAIIVAAAFMSLVMLLSLTTGYIGEFLLLVFMIINLGGSAGTYPLETSGIFYKLIHPFVPYTYSVNGFRKVISMTNMSIINEIIIFLGILIICSFLTILYYRFKNKKDQHLIPQAFEKVND